ncbi:MAG: hypothetical protein KJ905_02200 [Nanoarchaeota archaeon]|nr:hypothetical protein [Nanoarchaeota archaeon]MBU1501563.1 hypothetical protein [Nanoarchaeota archaeon]MBU2459095.1 hypothetical protein [Nanoarchaeota archaeon]
MPSQDLIEGLKYAMSRGDTLDKAMMTFYNSGYPKAEVEEAASELKSQSQVAPVMPVSIGAPTQQPTPHSQFSQVAQAPTSSPTTAQTAVKAPAPVYQSFPPAQSYSPSARESETTGRIIIVLLVMMLILLFGILLSIFVFRSQLSEFLTGLLK